MWVSRAALVMVAAALLGCAGRVMQDHADSPGLLSGIWHGFVAPLALAASLFSPLRIYVSPNSGWWYDLGFLGGMGLLGVAILFVSAAALATIER